MGELANKMGGLKLDSLADVFKLSESLIKAGDFVPAHFKGNPHAVTAAMITGKELGLSPMASLRGLYVVRGNVGVSYDVIVGLLRSHGYRIDWINTDASSATIKLTHKDGSSMQMSYTKEDAKIAGLWGGGVGWKNHPATMLRARCVSNAARAFAGEILSGVYCEDEIQEIAREEKVVEVQASPTSGNETLLSALNAPDEVVNDEPKESPEIQEDVSPNDELVRSEAFIDVNAMLNEAENIKDLSACVTKICKNKTLPEDETKILREKYLNKKADLEAKDDE